MIATPGRTVWWRCMTCGLLVYVLYFHGLGARELWSSHEARAAQDAQSILSGGEWRLPRLLDGRPELQKPPLYYWLTAGIAWCRGQVDEISVRLPATLGALLSALAVMVFLGKQGRWRTGFLAALVLLTMVHFTWMGRVGRIDMPLTAAVAWSLVGFWLGGRAQLAQLDCVVRPRPEWPEAKWAGGEIKSLAHAWGWCSLTQTSGWFLVGYVALAAGLMLKGPIAGVLVAAVLGPWLMLAKCWQRAELQVSLRRVLWSMTWGIPFVLLLVVPWCWWVNQETDGGFVREFLIKHNFNRGFGGDEQLDAHVNSWWFYLGRIWVDWLPWSLFLPAAGCWLWRQRREQPLAVLGLVWSASLLGLLSLLQYKRADYLLPAYPGAAIWLGLAVQSWWEQANSRRRSCMLRLGQGLCAAFLLGWFAHVQWILPYLEPARALRPFAQVVRQHYPRPGQVILFRIDSHHLVWELGPTTERIWEWENLEWWINQPAPVYVVMPERWARECDAQLATGRLTTLTTTTDRLDQPHELPLIFMVNEVGAQELRRSHGLASREK